MNTNHSWKIDPETGDYEQENGSPVIDRGLQTPAWFRLRTPRGKWMYAPDSKFGSDLRLIKKNQTASDSVAVENTQSRALQPLIDQKRASEIIVTRTEIQRNGVGTNIEIISSNGEEENFKFTPVGGVNDN